MSSAFDAVMNFFLGQPPEGLEAINYTFRCLMGLLFFDMLMDFFRWTKSLGYGRR